MLTSRKASAFSQRLFSEKYYGSSRSTDYGLRTYLKGKWVGKALFGDYFLLYFYVVKFQNLPTNFNHEMRVGNKIAFCMKTPRLGVTVYVHFISRKTLETFIAVGFKVPRSGREGVIFVTFSCFLFRALYAIQKSSSRWFECRLSRPNNLAPHRPSGITCICSFQKIHAKLDHMPTLCLD